MVGSGCGEGAVGRGSFGEGQGTVVTLLLYANFVMARPVDIVTRRVVVFTRATRRRGRSISKIVGSTAKRPMVNTDILRGKAAGNAVASFSNEFALGMVPNAALVVSCVNCGAMRVGAMTKRPVGLALARSDRVLRRIMIMKCNAVHGGSLANSMMRVGPSGVTSRGPASIRSILHNAPKLRVNCSTSTGNDSTSVLLHKRGSLNAGTDPVVMLSNVTFCNRLSRVGPSSVTRVSILGSTSSTTVCNTGTTTNIVVVAAGGNGRNGPIVGMNTGLSISEGSSCHSCFSTTNCLGFRRS